jgi:glycosyltransferase involved in cell wall biosynthesis
MSLVSVVIPVFNADKYVGQAVESALGQTFRDIEVIVVDDGSTDASPDVIAQFGYAVHCIRQENQGVAAARNTGINAARGEYIAVLDADDVWLPHKLERQMTYFNLNPRLAAVGCGYLMTDEHLNVIEERVPSKGELSELLLLRSNGGLNGSTLLARKQALQQVGGYDPRLAIPEDWDLAIRLVQRFEVDTVSEVLVLYRQHDSNSHRNISLMERSQRLMMDKAFGDGLPRDLIRLRRRAYSNLYRVLAGSYWHARDPHNAIRCALSSLAWHPGNLPYMAGLIWRRRKSVF